MLEAELVAAEAGESADLLAIARALRAGNSQSRAQLIASTGQRFSVPQSVVYIVVQACTMLARGQGVALAAIDRQVTTQAAADMLGVSRPYFIKLLNEGAIPHTKIGRHRRVKFGDVVKYMHARNTERRERLAEMVRQAEEDGLYDLPEFPLEETRQSS